MNQKLFFFIIANLAFLLASGQDKGNITGKYYITNIDIVVSEFNVIADTLTGEKFIARAGTKFTAYEIKKSNNLLVKFWNYKDTITQVQPVSFVESEDYNYISAETNRRYFFMDIDDFNTQTSEFYGTRHSFIWGFSTLPIKLRFGNDDRAFHYTTSSSLGVNVGYEWGIKGRKDQALGFLLGFGISSIEIDPESTMNYIDKSLTTSAFTPSVGCVYSFENFQIGVFSGIDFIAGDLGKNWMYRNKPWLGLGLGFTIFQKNKTENDVQQSQK